MRLTDDVVIMGNRALCRSYAKINLTLDVTGKRDDGYHNVEMIMQTVGLFDMIIIDRAHSGIKISCNLEYLPTNEKNIAYKAAKVFFEETGINGGAKILINKNIPVSAGLAGGSGNCGAVLCGLNKLYGSILSYKRILEIGGKLGADVPFCINGGTCFCSGIGDVLTDISGMKQTTVLLVKPPISVSTPSVYMALDDEIIEKRPDTMAMIDAIKNKNLQDVCKNFCNVMEPVTQRMYPCVRGIKEKMLMDGALGALMSGSGPTVFGFFSDERKAKKSADSFYKQYKDVAVCKTLN